MTIGYAHKAESIAPGASLVIGLPTLDGSALRYFSKIGKQVEVLSGTQQVQKIQFVAQAGMSDGDNVIIYDEDGQGWGFWTDKSGGATEPNFNEWNALDSDHKIQVDISGDTTADQVATNFRAARLAFSAAIPFTDKFSVNAVSGGAWDATNLFPTNGYIKTVTQALPFNEDGTNAGAISIANVAPGAEGFVDPANDKFKSAAHGFVLNDIIQAVTNDTLPNGINLNTNYFVNPLNADEFELYDSAIPGGNLIDINNFGLGTQTIGNVGVNITLKVEGSMLPQGNTAALFYAASSQNITNPGFNYQGLTNWEFVQAKITLTNNGAAATYVDIGATCKP